ncbi:hypothetical protein K1T71_000900 [Dendrolimus kikuchii]|uniref:Uncharacterized protein n=1 Tax=Dendrolimus kikuchii TaxID=765133 RepID=A0ACC1DG35_9NEOP|nr:hypothetical protein K1T71_000900 [Dendrolimus kikuchii]
MDPSKLYVSNSNAQVNEKPCRDSESVTKIHEGHSFKSHHGACCVCRKQPNHSRSYYGHLFCIGCFHKYIWSPGKRDSSGDNLKIKLNDVTCQEKK